MRFLSVYSGIEAASVAWRPLGWQAVALSEVAPFPCALLAHHYTHVPYRGRPASDSARYRALGNSWAINCARWIGERIQAVDAACAAQEAARPQQGGTP